MMQNQDEVFQNRNRMPFWGLFCGMAVMLGLPLITLTAGQNLSDWVQMILILMALLVGSVMAATATFFGIVLPYARARFSKYGGLLSGMAVMLGVPLLILSRGQNLAEWMQVLLIVVAILAGAVMAMTSIFFGLVVPQAKVNVNINRGDGACFFNPNANGPEVQVDDMNVQVNDGKQRVRVDASGVQVENGQQKVSVSTEGAKVEG